MPSFFFLGGGESACDGGVRANREGGFSLPSLYALFASLFPLYPRNFYKTTSQSLCDCSATLSVAQLKHDTIQVFNEYLKIA